MRGGIRSAPAKWNSIRACIAVAGAFLCIVPARGRAAEDGAPPSDAPWSAWIAALGSGDWRVRDAVEAALLREASRHRENIREALRTTDDPEVRFRLERVWAEARWRLFEGFTAAAAAPLRGPFHESETQRAWDAALERFGAPLVRAVVELRQDAGREGDAAQAFARISGKLSAEETACAIAAALREGGPSGEYRSLLRDAADGRHAGANRSRLAEIALRLWWHAEALWVAQTGYARNPGDAFADLALTAARHGRLEAELRTAAGVTWSADSTAESGERLFYVELLQRMGERDRLAALLPEDAFAGWPPDSMRRGVERLLEAGWDSAAIERMLGAEETAHTLFLRRSIRLARGGVSPAESAALFERAIDAAAAADDRGATLLRLGEWAGPVTADAARCWERILETQTGDDRAVLQAALQLGRYREIEDRPREAVELYERALAGVGGSSGIIVRKADGAWGDGRAFIESRVRDLRARLEKQPPPP